MRKLMPFFALVFCFLAGCVIHDEQMKIAEQHIADAGQAIQRAEDMGAASVAPSEISAAKVYYQNALNYSQKESKASSMAEAMNENQEFKKQAAKSSQLAQKKAEEAIKKMRQSGIQMEKKMDSNFSSNMSDTSFSKQNESKSKAKDIPQPGPDFKLGPEDVLEISVWKEEELSKQVAVLPDGRISFPLIGDIMAQGRTVEELRQTIKERLKDYMDATVTVLVIHIGSPKVHVLGKVLKPGVYILMQPTTVMEILAIVGGTTPFADMSNIVIIRKNNAKQRAIKFDYKAVSEGKKLEQNIMLKAGDTVVVP